MNTQNSAIDVIINSEEEYDQFLKDSMPMLLERASTYSKKILKETNEWSENVSHEKLALRLGYELVERFLILARHEIPCRPALLLDSFVAKQFSQPTSFVNNHKPSTPLETFIDGLASKAVVSRDALIAQFTHFYALTPSQVIKLLGLAEEQSQRIYKNFTRWRQSGWHRTMKEIGLTLPQITDLEQQLEKEPHAVSQKAKDILMEFQSHYRKSEPEHYSCQTKEQWGEMLMDGHGHDYRVWHLAMCFPCLSMVYHSAIEGELSEEPLKMNLQIQPWLETSKSLAQR
ncbi:MAG: hypothetical protein NPIRA04_06490 [Nitrospirales bacterium]|nr:MAG: hypothetical protein NPIRA04_06490 [Nitrospirales bacterium]